MSQEKTVGITGNGTSFRNITVVPSKFLGGLGMPGDYTDFNSILERYKAHELGELTTMARSVIHNFVDLCINSYDFQNKELHFSLYTKDSSYDLNRFYQELSDNHYILK